MRAPQCIRLMSTFAVGICSIALVAAAPTAPAAGATATAIAQPTVWLCNPVTLKADPCRGDLTTTVQSSLLGGRVVRPSAPHTSVDCFYVYPTVSNQLTPFATASVDPEERSIATYQAQRFSQDCRVFAPIYRQATLKALFAGGTTQAGLQIAYLDVLSAFRDYLAHYNRGRGIVLIGHSQGTLMLARLIASQFDRNPALRSKLVSAVLLGGNVTVRAGSDRGGEFANVPICTRPAQIGCIIAYSTFMDNPPVNAAFGRIGGLADPTLPPKAHTVDACTNPGSLASNRQSELTSYVPTQLFAPGLILAGILITFGGVPPVATTPWVEPADRYTGRCEWINGVHVFKLRQVAGARHLTAFPDATWGVHLVDVNIALGQLVDDIASQAGAYIGRSR